MSACAGQNPPATSLTVSWKIRELRLKETCSIQSKAHACSVSCSCFQRHSQIDPAPCPPGLFFICIKQIHSVPNSTILFFLFYYYRGCKAKLHRISKITEKLTFVKGQLSDVRGKCDGGGCQKSQSLDLLSPSCIPSSSSWFSGIMRRIRCRSIMKLDRVNTCCIMFYVLFQKCSSG